MHSREKALDDAFRHDLNAAQAGDLGGIEKV
jgi:hypothetical protein